MESISTTEVWYSMYALGLLETLYIQYSDELTVFEVASRGTDPGWITFVHRSVGSLFTIVKAK